MERASSGCLGADALEALAAGGAGTPAVVSHLAHCRACAEALDAARFGLRFGEVMRDEGEGAAAAPGVLEVPGYRVLGELARGGQGVVYGAEQTTTGQKVAIKVLHPSAVSAGGSRAARTRFLREIHIAGALSHPGIVRLLDSVCLSDGRDALVLELVEGEALDVWARRARASVDGRAAVLGVLAGAAEALEHAHQRGVIHRDLKPSNVLVDSDGRAHLLDFGVARRTGAEGSARVTRTGEFTGTLAYAAPEQVTQGSGGPDVRSDVYAMGVMGFEALSGRLPYAVNGSLETVIRNIVSAEVPAAGRAGIDADAWAVLARAMAKEPGRRYQSAGELARELRRAESGEAVDARRDSRWYVLRMAARRHRLAVSVVAAAAAGLVGVAAALAAGNARLSAALHESRLLQVHAHIEADARARAEEMVWPMLGDAGIGGGAEAVRLLWTGTRAQREALWAFVEMQSRGECAAVLGAERGAPGTITALADGGFGVVGTDEGGTRMRRVGLDAAGRWVAQDSGRLAPGRRIGWMLPDGRRVLTLGAGGVAVESAVGSAEPPAGGIESPGWAAAWAAGEPGASLAVAVTEWGAAVSVPNGGLWVYALPGLELLLEREGLPGQQLVWLHPTERRAAWVESDGALRVGRLEGPADRRVPAMPVALGYPGVLVLMDDAERMAVLVDASGVQTVDLSSAEPMVRRLPWGAALTAGTLDRRGVWLATRQFGDPAVELWDTRSWQRVGMLPGHEGTASDLAFSRDGAWIGTVDRAGVVRVWPAPGRGWRRMLGAPTARALDIAMAADGSVFAADAAGGMRRLGTLGAEEPLVRSGLVATKAAVLGAGLVAVLGEDERVEVHEIGGHEEPAVWAGDGSWAVSARFAPDGSALAVCTRAGSVVLLEPRSGLERARVDVGEDAATGVRAMPACLRFSPDGRTLAVAMRDGRVVLLDGRTLEGRREVRVSRSQVRGVEWLPENGGLLAFGDEGRVAQINPQSGRVRLSERVSEHSLFTGAAHPAGRMVLVGDRAGRVHALDTRSLSVLATLDAGAAVMSLAFEHGGGAVAVAAMDRAVERWDFSRLAETLDAVRAR